MSHRGLPGTGVSFLPVTLETSRGPDADTSFKGIIQVGPSLAICYERRLVLPLLNLATSTLVPEADERVTS